MPTGNTQSEPEQTGFLFDVDTDEHEVAGGPVAVEPLTVELAPVAAAEEAPVFVADDAYAPAPVIEYDIEEPFTGFGDILDAVAPAPLPAPVPAPVQAA